jgi:hypothetical protein
MGVELGGTSRMLAGVRTPAPPPGLTPHGEAPQDERARPERLALSHVRVRRVAGAGSPAALAPRPQPRWHHAAASAARLEAVVFLAAGLVRAGSRGRGRSWTGG